MRILTSNGEIQFSFLPVLFPSPCLHHHLTPWWSLMFELCLANWHFLRTRAGIGVLWFPDDLKAESRHLKIHFSMWDMYWVAQERWGPPRKVLASNAFSTRGKRFREVSLSEGVADRVFQSLSHGPMLLQSVQDAFTCLYVLLVACPRF